jgi:sugar lactone lactonase YvrE
MRTAVTPARIAIIAAILGSASHHAQAADAPTLIAVARIELRAVEGRLDHLAHDSAGHRLFVTELANGSVDVLDLQSQKVIHRIEGLHDPQGIAFSSTGNRIFIANGADGTVQAYRGNDYSIAATVKLGADADNLRLDEASSLLFAGYGKGAIAALDTRTLERRGEIALDGHPEGFQLSATDSRVFINVPDSAAVVVADRTRWRRTASWRVERAQANYPMASDPARARVLVVFRKPASIAALSITDGTTQASGEVCADADDLFLDEGRNLVYVVCGAGFVDILDAGSLRRMGRRPTSPGARTGLFVRGDDRLYVAVPAQGKSPAAIWVMRPSP